MVELQEALTSPERLADLRLSGLLDSPPEATFDRITRLLVGTLGVPVALVSLVDDHRQFFKSQVGVEDPWASLRGTPLSHSFCQQVVATDAMLVIEDSREDERVVGNLAIEDLGVVAYAGAPLHGLHGEALGSVCAIDHAPRTWTPEELELVSDLARITSELVSLRTAAVATRSAVLDLSHQVRTGLAAARLEAEQLDPGTTAGLRAALDRVSGSVTDTLAGLDRQPRPAASATSARESLLGCAARHQGEVEVTAPEPDVLLPVPPAALSEVLDGMVSVLRAHGDGPVVLSLVPGDGFVRLRAHDASAGLPADVARDLLARSDVAHDVPADPSLAELAARDLGARLLLGTGSPTSLELLLPTG